MRIRRIFHENWQCGTEYPPGPGPHGGGDGPGVPGGVPGAVGVLHGVRNGERQGPVLWGQKDPRSVEAGRGGAPRRRPDLRL